MLIYKHSVDWDSPLLVGDQKIKVGMHQQEELVLIAVEFPDLFNYISKVDEKLKDHTRSQLANMFLYVVVDDFAKVGAMQGLLKATHVDGSVLSPFAATHDYCITVNAVTLAGEYAINVSPIYHLGLDYPDDYRDKHGHELNKEAIIGLIEIPFDGVDAKYYRYGIDAGVVFKEAQMPHNVSVNLNLSLNANGAQAILSCGDLVTSRTLSWKKLGVSYPYYDSQRVGHL